VRAADAPAAEAAEAAAAAAGAGGAAPASSGPPTARPPPTITQRDFLVFHPALELLYLWNCLSQSQRLVDFTVAYCDGWLAAAREGRERLYVPGDLKRVKASGGVFGLGGQPPVSARADEDEALARLLRAAALRLSGRAGDAARDLDLIDAWAAEGRVTGACRLYYVPAMARFERGLLLATAGDARGAAAAFDAVHAHLGQHDVHFGNRLSFRTKQMALDVGAGRAVV
jgi:hypothetical protein